MHFPLANQGSTMARMRTSTIASAVIAGVLLAPACGAAEPRQAKPELIYKSRVDELRTPASDGKQQAGKRKPRTPRRFQT